MIIVYFDASATSPERVGQGPVTRGLTVVTACVTSLDAWRAYELKWRYYLDKMNKARRGLSPITYMHRQELEAKREPWAPRLIEEMADLMTSHVPFVVSLGVDPAVWSEACKHNDHLNTHTPFSFCVLQCLHEVTLWSDRKGLTDSRVFVLEDGDGQDAFLYGIRTHILHAPKIKTRFRWHGMYLMAKTGKKRPVGEIEDPLNTDLPVRPLELSDGIAWEHRRMGERGDLRAAIPTKDTTPLIRTLQQQDRFSVGNYDLDTLATLKLDPDGVVLTQYDYQGVQAIAEKTKE